MIQIVKLHNAMTWTAVDNWGVERGRVSYEPVSEAYIMRVGNVYGSYKTHADALLALVVTIGEPEHAVG